jgi:hypothetical protein
MTRLPALLLLAASLAAGCASAGSPDASPPLDPRTMIPPGISADWIHFTDPVVAPGAPAPAFRLPTPDGLSSLSLANFLGKPLVVVFGSYT